MNTVSLLLRLSQFTAVLMIAGWIGVVCTAVFLPGGHPPLSAYVGIAVIVGSWGLGTIGVLAGLLGVMRQKTSGKKVALVFLCVNAGLLAFSVLVNFM